MNLSDDLRAWCIETLSSNTFRQIAPLFVLLFVPALVITLATKAERISLFYRIAMVLESIGINLPWNWFSGGSSVSSSGKLSNLEKKKGKKHLPRTRAEQIALQNESEKGDEDDGHYPGLVNISGTYCFMNSTLQALASLSYLQPHIDAIHAKAEALDVPSPVIDSLQDLFRQLNTPRSSYTSIRPLEIIDVLTNHVQGRTNSLFYSREHQDAQELFQLVSECIKNEIAAVDREGYRDRGLGGLSQASETNREIGKSVFDGLTANRRSCVVCGYTEAVMHFAFDNWQLAVPRLASSCRLEDCLEDYTRLEILRDCICRKCSMLATHRRLLQDVAALEESTRPDAKPSTSKKRRLKEVRKMEARVKASIDEARIEDDLKDIRMEKVFSTASTKQAMVARPPPVLALHINRSIHYGQYASKNNVHVIFPEALDLTPFTTSGNLSTVPTSAISTPPPSIPRSTTPTPATYATPRTIYRLSAVVCHYGQHSFGHYICYRRKPKNNKWMPPTLVDPLKVSDSSDTGFPKYEWEDEDPQQHRPGKGWLQISDDTVRECGIETVLQEGSGAFMLYYERAVHANNGIYPSRNASPKGSEETLKPEIKTVNLNGSVGSLISEVGIGIMMKEKEDKWNGNAIASGSVGSPNLGPRIVRNVAGARRRSASVAASTRESSVTSTSLDSLSTSSDSSTSWDSMTSQSVDSLPSLKHKPSPPPNGVVHHRPNTTDHPPTTPSMSTSSPSFLASPSSKSATPPRPPLPSVSSLPNISHYRPESHIMQSPKLDHPPVVGLKA